MGIATNARGQLRQAQRVDGEILRMIAGDRVPGTLTAAEVDHDHNPITRPKVAEPVWVWVHYGDRAIRVEAELVGWTDRCGAVRWMVPGLGVHRSWVWLGAVEARPQLPVG